MDNDGGGVSAGAERVDVLAVRRWVAELSVSANGMHEIREGAVNERERPLVGYAATYEQARGIAAAHNDSAAVAELIEAAQELDEELDGPAIAHRMRAALARVEPQP